MKKDVEFLCPIDWKWERITLLGVPRAGLLNPIKENTLSSSMSLAFFTSSMLSGMLIFKIIMCAFFCVSLKLESNQ